MSKKEDRFERADRRIRELLPPGFKYGYIGNVESWGDDRGWAIWSPHPGRAGTAADRVGGYYSTEERVKLLPLAKALRVGYDAGLEDK